MSLRHLVRAAAALVVLLATLGLSAAPASAHASLVAADPPDGARVDESPDTVQLTFSETVSASLGGVRVLAPDGTRVDTGAARASGAVVEVDLRPDLPDGTYVISYRVISADGHPVRGGSVFGVGDAEVDLDALGRVGAAGDDRAWEAIGAIGRGLSYAGTLLAAGGALFLAVAHRTGPERRSLVRLVRGAALVGALAAFVALPVQAALGTGLGAGSLLDDGVLREVLADGVGLGLGLCVVGLLGLGLVLTRSPRLAAIAAVVAAGSFAATGHTRAGDQATVATLADLAHLLVAAVWGGGLVLLWMSLRLRHRTPGIDRRETAAIVTRFSSLATVSVLAVGVTGAILGWNEVRTFDGLTGTGYGRLFLAKLATVAVVVAAGAYNHLRLVPALGQGKVDAAITRLRRTLHLEVVGLAAVVGLTSVLVVVTPARTSLDGGPVEVIAELGELGSVQVVVAPATAGPNQIHLYTFGPDGRPTALAESVVLELSLPAADLGPIERTATRAGPAHLQLNGNDLAVAGTWSMTVRVAIDRFTEATATVEIPVAP